MKMTPRVSIVLPTYNEVANIGLLIDKCRAAVQNNPLLGEIEFIVVDDNSPDGTGALCQTLASECPDVKVFIRMKEKGLGSAIKRGILESSGDIVVVMDADLSHDPSLVPTLVHGVADNSADIAVASRFADGGEMISSTRNVWGSKALNAFVRILLQIPIKDVTGGFLAIKKEALKKLDMDRIFTGYGDYCFVLLHKGTRQGWHAKEIGYKYRPRISGSSKTGFFRAGWSYGIRALRLKIGLE